MKSLFIYLPEGAAMGMQEAYKRAYQEKLEAQLKEWGAKIDVLRAKAEQAEANLKLEYYQQLDGLAARYEAACSRLKELHGASEGAWEALKAGAEKAWVDLREAVDSAISKFR